MKNKTTKITLASTALVMSASALMIASVLPKMADAETVVTHTETKTQDVPEVTKIDFKVFDLDGDGTYSMAEVGEKLFEAFDRDRNGSIDNLEWDKKSVHTIMPMEKETFVYKDYDDDGIVEETEYTYETFYKASGLVKFDKNQNGLTPAEFIEEGYEVLDKDEDKLISLEEWQAVYKETRMAHEDNETYN